MFVCIMILDASFRGADACSLLLLCIPFTQKFACKMEESGSKTCLHVGIIAPDSCLTIRSGYMIDTQSRNKAALCKLIYVLYKLSNTELYYYDVVLGIR